MSRTEVGQVRDGPTADSAKVDQLSRRLDEQSKRLETIESANVERADEMARLRREVEEPMKAKAAAAERDRADALAAELQTLSAQEAELRAALATAQRVVEEERLAKDVIFGGIRVERDTAVDTLARVRADRDAARHALRVAQAQLLEADALVDAQRQEMAVDVDIASAEAFDVEAGRAAAVQAQFDVRNTELGESAARVASLEQELADSFAEAAFLRQQLADCEEELARDLEAARVEVDNIAVDARMDALAAAQSAPDLGSRLAERTEALHGATAELARVREETQALAGELAESRQREAEADRNAATLQTRLDEAATKLKVRYGREEADVVRQRRILDLETANAVQADQLTGLHQRVDGLPAAVRNRLAMLLDEGEAYARSGDPAQQAFAMANVRVVQTVLAEKLLGGVIDAHHPLFGRTGWLCDILR